MFKFFVLKSKPSCFSAPTVNALSTDFNLNVTDKNVSDVVNPSEAIVAIINIGLLVSNNRALNEGKSNLKVNAMNKITIS